MLTGDLVRARVERSKIRPSLVDPTSQHLREVTDALLSLWQVARDQQWTRGRLAGAVDDLTRARRDHKTIRGIAKILRDRTTFDQSCPTDPVALRAEVFRLARERGPLALEKGLLDRVTAQDILEEVGSRHGLEASNIGEALYADLPQAQRVTEWKPRSVDWMLNRYNVALVQALLLKAVELEVELHRPTAPRMRQLFRYLKFFQLLHSAKRKGDTLTVRVDGPSSLFKQTTRYGRQLANFLPAVLLCEGPWSLRGTVLWTKARHKKTLTIEHGDGLVSHYRDTGAWRSPANLHFAERFRASDTKWALQEGRIPIDLGGRALIYPDYTLTAGKRSVHLEIVGFWRREWLDRRIELLNKFGPGNLVMAVSKKLRGCAESLEDFDGAVVVYTEVLSVKKVLAAVESITR